MKLRPLLAGLLGLLVVRSGQAQTAPTRCDAPRYDERFFPPWQHGANSDARERGIAFTVPQADVMADFHGDLTDPKLVLYVGGNYFFAMAPLVRRFEDQHPQLKGRLFWETIPPGLLADQIKAGGRITSGNMTFVAKADVYLAGLRKVKALVAEGLLEPPIIPFATNSLSIMVAKGNPAHIGGLADLARPDVRLAMPNPAFEGIAGQIKTALAKAGGADLVTAVYETKVKHGSAVLTHIHHRQTPLFLMQCLADAGVTWRSEALFQEQAGHPIAHVDIPEKENASGTFAGAVVKGAAHAETARDWLAFIKSPIALEIFARYGFKAYAGEGD